MTRNRRSLEVGAFSLAFSPNDDGSRVAVGCGDGNVRWIDAESGEVVDSWPAHEGKINDVRFSPDGALLVTAGTDHLAKVWDTESRKLLGALSGHLQPVYSAVFGPHGRMIATTSRDRTVRLWNITDQPIEAEADADRQKNPDVDGGIEPLHIFLLIGAGLFGLFVILAGLFAWFVNRFGHDPDELYADADQNDFAQPEPESPAFVSRKPPLCPVPRNVDRRPMPHSEHLDALLPVRIGSYIRLSMDTPADVCNRPIYAQYRDGQTEIFLELGINVHPDRARMGIETAYRELTANLHCARVWKKGSDPLPSLSVVRCLRVPKGSDPFFQTRAQCRLSFRHTVSDVAQYGAELLPGHVTTRCLLFVDSRPVHVLRPRQGRRRGAGSIRQGVSVVSRWEPNQSLEAE